MSDETDMHALRSDVAALKAQVAGQVSHIERIDNSLKDISEYIHRKPDRNLTPVVATGITGVIGLSTILISLGTMALSPVQKQLEVQANKIENLQTHDADGHPEAVFRIISRIDSAHTREREANRVSINRFEDRIDGLSDNISKLGVITEERTQRFKLQSGDRWTGGQQTVYAKGVERRLREIERKISGQ